jgi:hypothetical protein
MNTSNIGPNSNPSDTPHSGGDYIMPMTLVGGATYVGARIGDLIGNQTLEVVSKTLGLVDVVAIAGLVAWSYYQDKKH